MENLRELLRQGRALWGKNQLNESKAIFEKAADIALQNKLSCENRFFLALISHLEGNSSKALGEYLALIAEDSFLMKGYAFFNAGRAYRDMKQYDGAIQHFDNALKQEDFDDPGAAWFNKGIAHERKMEYQMAVECYQKAVQCNDYDNPGNAWHNIGNVYYDTEDFDKAIDCYGHALEASNFDSAEYAWRNMGNAHYKKREYSEATRCYKREAALRENRTGEFPVDDASLIDMAEMLIPPKKETVTRSALAEETSDFLSQMELVVDNSAEEKRRTESIDELLSVSAFGTDWTNGGGYSW